MYGGYYSDDDEYDPMRHMMEDPVDFQMHGYGGFGYDTSHVRPDEPLSALVKKVTYDDLEGVKRVVSPKGHEEKEGTGDQPCPPLDGGRLPDEWLRQGIRMVRCHRSQPGSSARE